MSFRALAYEVGVLNHVSLFAQLADGLNHVKARLTEENHFFFSK